ncbi:MAG: hypothetical protein K2X80_04980 [Pseudomonadaceae bacterium]|nr:hypothetical protein [Pseudomonadaceae bacterium]
MAEDWTVFAGKMSDREVSRRFGVGSSTVNRYRLRNCIPPHDPRNSVSPEGLLERLSTCSNYRLARDFNIPTNRIEALRAEVGTPEPRVQRPRFLPLEDEIWTEEMIALLGTMPDPELADRLGVSRMPVKEMRKELDIPAYKPYPEITAEVAAEFGNLSDSAIAKRLGVSASFIRRARLKWMGS